MIKRERWIVYPLLFLVISMGLKDKLNSQQKNLRLKTLVVDQLDAGRIVTPAIQGGIANFREVVGALIQGRHLQVVDDQAVPKVVLHVVPTTKDKQSDDKKSQGAVTVISGENNKMVSLGGGGSGGYIAARSTANPQDFLAFGYQAGRVGMFWMDKNGQPQGFLKPETSGSPKQKATPPESPSSESNGQEKQAPKEEAKAKP